ncbi:MAG TPA: hypothetical protein VN554_02685 [Verrucomicrobiae bacterium]|nr:hypothetical protein [Verrucomicrobiae bacterium]
MANKFPPGLEATRPVLNIGKKEFSSLRRALIDHESEPQDPQEVGQLLQPRRELFAEIIARGELVRLHRAMRMTNVSQEHVEELIEYLQGVLPPFSRKRVIEAPTMPAEIQHVGDGVVLSVAGSAETLQERALVIGAIGNFYQLDAMPDNVWFPDERVTSVWLARAKQPQQIKMVELLQETLAVNPNLLPPTTDLGSVDIHPDFD